MVRVTLLTADGCHYCERAREVLARLAKEWPLEMQELPIESEVGAAMALRDGVAFPPAIYLNGQLVGYGRLSEGKLWRRLAELAAT